MSHNSIGRIILRNTITLFNIVNIILALMIISVGSYKNLTFLLIAIANTLISIINEVRAKKIIDKMRLISEQKPTVIRDGKTYQIPQQDIKKGDLIVLALGDQIMFDSVIEKGNIEVNEAFITGEQDNIEKRAGDELTSGSFVVSGTCTAKVKNIGEDNLVNKLESTARTIKTEGSKLFKLMNNIVKYISYTLIPIGALLLWARFRAEANTTEAVTSTVAGLINMIPEGLILLTSSVLALATIRLAKKKVLVQDLYSIETLARVDTICLDKTGTITTGNMTVKDIIPAQGQDKNALINALELILGHIPADNATSRALARKFLKSAKNRVTAQNSEDVEVIPFSSDRKYSGVRIGKTEYLMGALEFMTDDESYLEQEKSLKGPHRILAVMKIEGGREKYFSANIALAPWDANGRRPANTAGVTGAEGAPRRACEVGEESTRQDPRSTLLGFIVLEDEIRKDAKEIINYFYKNDVAVKIISGDDLETVKSIASSVGVKDLRGIDLSTQKSPDYAKLVKDYAIFTRVKPQQKKSLIAALRKQGNTVAMTGDGVNDILAMKEADCSIAIGEGSDAARRSAKIVLLESDFAAVPSIIDEGRQSINNLERSTALFLAKTVYASILAVLFVFLPLRYPFNPTEMSLISFACIGFPGLILALEKNTSRIKNLFLHNILLYSFPIGLTVAVSMLALSISADTMALSRMELNTAALLIVYSIDLVLIYWISRPLNLLRGALFASIIAILIAAFLIPLARTFFEFTNLSQGALITTIAIIAASLLVFTLMKRLMRSVFTRITQKS